MKLWIHFIHFVINTITIKNYTLQNNIPVIIHTKDLHGLWQEEVMKKMGGLYEVSILGSGDFNIALALLNKNSLHCKMTKEYK